MQIKEIMCKSVITTNRDASISQVAKLLHENKIHGIPVVEGKHLVGIITETDFFIKGETEIHLPSYVDFLSKTGISIDIKSDKPEGLNDILSAKAEDIMTSECISMNPEDDVREFLKVVKEKNIHTAPVAIGDILVGIVTVADVIKLI